jgi:hypothetical protein
MEFDQYLAEWEILGRERRLRGGDGVEGGNGVELAVFDVHFQDIAGVLSAVEWK